MEKKKAQETGKRAAGLGEDKKIPKIGDIIMYRPKKYNGDIPVDGIPPGLTGDQVEFEE